MGPPLSWRRPGRRADGVAVARGRLLDHKGRRATFGFVLNELEESRPLLRAARGGARGRVGRHAEAAARRLSGWMRSTARPSQAPCWGIDVRGRKSCLSYDEALAADDAFPPAEEGLFAFVVAWCGDGFDWVADLMARSRAPRRSVIMVDLISKVAPSTSAHLQRRRGPRGPVHARPIGHTQTPGAGLRRDRSQYDAHVDRRAPRHPETLARAAGTRRGQSAGALDIRVVPLIEPGRGYPTGPRGRANMFYSTDEAGAYLHHIALSYDDLADGTFFLSRLTSRLRRSL